MIFIILRTYNDKLIKDSGYFNLKYHTLLRKISKRNLLLI